MTISDEAAEAAAGTILWSSWGHITPEEAARRILESTNQTVWPRRVPSYGNTGTIRKARSAK